MEGAFELIGREHGRVDLLVNSAGIGLISAPHETSMAEFTRLVAVDLRGCWLRCKYALPLMLRQRSGAIVNIGSVHGTAMLRVIPCTLALKRDSLALREVLPHSMEALKSEPFDRSRTCGQ